MPVITDVEASSPVRPIRAFTLSQLFAVGCDARSAFFVCVIQRTAKDARPYNIPSPIITNGKLSLSAARRLRYNKKAFRCFSEKPFAVFVELLICVGGLGVLLYHGVEL